MSEDRDVIERLRARAESLRRDAHDGPFPSPQSVLYEEAADEIERLRAFVATQPCECYDEYGKHKPEPADDSTLGSFHTDLDAPAAD